MSECVVRMEMPKGCGSCPIANFGYCSINHKQVGDPLMGYPENRPGNCPIICSLPEGHGRLVDADAMAKDLDYDVELDAKALDDMELVGNERERIQFDKDCKQNCMWYLTEQETLVPADTAESPSPKPTDPVPIRDVYYVMTECDAKTGTVKYEPRERIEP